MVKKTIHDNWTYLAGQVMEFEKIIPAIWELYPVQGSRTLLFGKNLTSHSAGKIYLAL
jgi:hypothetical protein